MLELLTGAGLAISAGLNAYIPLLAIGLAGRFLDFVTLPPSSPRTSGFPSCSVLSSPSPCTSRKHRRGP